jgi:transitional endoplasmic reticulum ATPase
MSDSPMDTNKALATFAQFLESSLQKSADEARRTDRSKHYKELGLKWSKESTEIQLPGNPKLMTPEEAIQVLIDFKAMESQTYNVLEFLPGMPYDAAHAFVQVLRERYGWVNPQTKKTFFGDIPPKMVMVRTGSAPNDFVEVPVGKFKLQDISADLETGFTRAPDNKSGSFVSFFVRAEVKHEDRKVIMDLINRTRRYLETNSIYRGKAMRLPVDRSGQVEATVEPSFIDLSKVSEAGLVLTKVNYDLLATTVWTPIRHTAEVRKQNIPLKRGALLWGEYGTGKTLSALVTAKIAQDNGWTFIMLDDPKGLVQALEMAKLYQPAVVFAEDIDRVVVRDRNDAANDILNTIDGAVQKNSEIITVLTTNHIDRINQGMLRPGRLDALIHVTKPDAEAAVRLVRLYAGSLLAETEPLTSLGKHLEGYIPSIIAEVVNRSKLGMISRGEKRLIEDDLIIAAESLKAHSKLLQEDDKKPSAEEAVGIALKKLLSDPVASYNGDLEEDIEVVKDRSYSAASTSSDIYSIVDDQLPKIRRLLENASGGANGTTPITKADVAEMKAKLDAISSAVRR